MVSKAIMISIRPEWCEKISRGEKTIEVRKTFPKIRTPFKCYIYCTKTGLVSKSTKNETLVPVESFGKVVGEFVCDQIVDYSCIWGFENRKDCIYNTCSFDEDYTCLTDKQMGEYGRGNPLYGWHISDLKIYDDPKPLSEFRVHCGKPYCYEKCPITLSKECNSGRNGGFRELKQPPQSWCYVEELNK